MFSSSDAIITLITDGAILGGVIGLVMGAIAWMLTQKGGQALGLMMVGGLVGLFIGIYLEGLPVVEAMGLGTVNFLYSSRGTQNTAFIAIINMLKWVLGGMAIGGAITSFSRAAIGAIAGGVAGTVAGVLLIAANGQYNLGLNANLMSLLTAVATMMIVLVMSLGAAE